MSEEQRVLEAKKRVKRKKDFYEHFTTYLIISVFLVALNLITSPGRWWFHWPILGWGMAVLFNYLDVFGVPGIGPMNKEWEEQAIEEELRKMKKEGYSSLPPAQKDKEGLELRQLERRRRKNDWNEGDLV